MKIALLSVFLFHGWSKLTGIGGFAEMMELPILIALLVALAETVGGIAVFVGGFTKDLITRLGALALVSVMLGAIFMVHWGQWHFMATDTHPMGGMQFQVTLLFMALYLLIKGNNFTYLPLYFCTFYCTLMYRNSEECEIMKTVHFTDFRKKASTYFSDVEKGETLVIVRHGKPIAEISPVEGTDPDIPAWKRPGIKLALKGASLSNAIMEERKSYNQK